jgi:hypothetical protein
MIHPHTWIPDLPFVTPQIQEQLAMSLKLKTLGANRTELTLDDGTVVLFSYSTPVAAHVPGVGYVRTEQSWSRTTAKHIGQWGAREAPTRPQAFFDALV